MYTNFNSSMHIIINDRLTSFQVGNLFFYTWIVNKKNEHDESNKTGEKIECFTMGLRMGG